MSDELNLPLGVSVSGDIEYRPDRKTPYRARVRWVDPVTKKRPSKSDALETEDEAKAWIDNLKRLAAQGIDPSTATMTLADYGTTNMPLALRGLEAKTTDPYLAGWRKRVVPTLGHLTIGMITNGAVDRAVHSWIADECSRSTVKNSIAVLVRVMEQALRDGIIDRKPGAGHGLAAGIQAGRGRAGRPAFAGAAGLGLADHARGCAGGEVIGELSRLG